jgi:ubiquinone biosynthesis protein
VRLSKAFTFVDQTPLAAASIAQVHRATLRDGRAVALKIQRPGIREQMLHDLEAMGDIVNFLVEHTEVVRARLQAGGDPPDHARAQHEGDRGDLRPRADPRLQQLVRAHKVEFISGTKVTGVPQADAARRHVPRRSASGNVFLVNGKIALIDLGMVAHVTPGLQDRLLQLLLAVAENRARTRPRRCC